MYHIALNKQYRALELIYTVNIEDGKYYLIYLGTLSRDIMKWFKGTSRKYVASISSFVDHTLLVTFFRLFSASKD